MEIRNWLMKVLAPKQNVSKPAGILTPPYTFIDGTAHPGNFEALSRAYEDYIYICASYNAEAVAKVPLRLYAAKPDNKKLLFNSKTISKKTLDYLSNSHTTYQYISKAIDIEEIVDEEHPFLKLIKNVNPFMNGFDLLEYTQQGQELVGNSYWYIVFKNTLGVKQPEQLWILPPQNVRIKTSKTDFIAGYKYRNGMDNIDLDVDEVIHFKMSNPNDLYYGFSPLMGISETYNLNKFMAKYNIAIFRNLGMPDGFFVAKDRLTDEDLDRLTDDIQSTFGGVGNVGKTGIFDNGVDYKPISVSPKELAFLASKQMTKEKIANAFKVPMSKLGTDNVNLANAEQGNKQYAEDCLLPRLTRIEQKLNEQLMPYYDNNLFCAFDNVVPENEAAEVEKHTKYVESGILTRNEVRTDINMPPHPDGDKLSGTGEVPNFEPNPDTDKLLIDIGNNLDKALEDYTNHG